MLTQRTGRPISESRLPSFMSTPTCPVPTSTPPTRSSRLLNVCVIGAGEYTTGLVNDKASLSDKSSGVVGLTLFHLRQRQVVGQVITLCGTQGHKMSGVRQHLHERIQKRYGIDVTCFTYPSDHVSKDTHSYEEAIERHHQPGDVAIITTPDDTHYDIATYCLSKHLHVLIAKPIVQTLQLHYHLIQLTRTHNRLCAGEMHKRYDPFYQDATMKIASGAFGQFTYYSAFMSQPKSQLETFNAWIGNGTTDISYYLNSHHVDFLCHALTCDTLKYRPIRVFASSSYGFANEFLCKLQADKSQSERRELHHVDDSITLVVTFENVANKHQVGTGVFTSCWTAPLKGDAHTQQGTQFIGHKGELLIDQAHRGYKSTLDDVGVASHNPLFFTYTPNSKGEFQGENAYGYRSFEYFIRAATRMNRGETVDDVMSTITSVTSEAAIFTTAILEAGSLSLKHQKHITLSHEENEIKYIF